MKFKPLGDRVVIKALEEGESQVGGIIIPDTAKEKPSKGEVVAVGPGRRKKTGEHIPMEVAAGDKVLYGKYSGNEIDVEGQKLLILHEDEILAKI
jgi:chaperonin GroES